MPQHQHNGTTQAVKKAAKKAQWKPIESLQQKDRQDKNSSLLLYKVCVRTTPLYGCVVWRWSLFPTSGYIMGNHNGKPGVHNRNAPKAKLGVNKDVRNETVYALAGKFPLKVQTAK